MYSFNQEKKYTQEEINYICSKITDIPFKLIPESLKKFWLEWRQTNEK